MIREIPKFRTEQEAVQFLEQDLSDLDFSQFKPVTFEFQPNDVRLDMRVPQHVLDAIKLRVKAKGMPVNRYVRELMERDALRSGN